MNKFALVLGALALSAGSAMATTFDPIFVESSGNRPSSEGDITGTRVITPDIGAGDAVGLAGRIVNAVDKWEFTVLRGWSIGFVDLDLDDQKFFDSSNITDPCAGCEDNGDVTSAIFSIFEASDLSTAIFTTNSIDAVNGGGTENTALDFVGVAGTYVLKIDGSQASTNNPGATYDIGITAVPLPAAGWMLIAGLGGLAAMRRRKKAS